ncbi:hypothetical protein JCM3774_006519 [Rhodotorula dairenensis]
MSHVDPLPQELANVRRAAHAAHSANQQHVDSVIARLERARDSLVNAQGPGDELLSLTSYLKQSGTESQTTHKEWANAVNRLAKSVEKKYGAPPAPLFPPPPPSLQQQQQQHPSPPTLCLEALRSSSTRPHLAPTHPGTTQQPGQPVLQERLPFSNPEAIAALNETIAVHLARIGAFASLSTFLAESETPQPAALTPELVQSLRTLHAILDELKRGHCASAIAWVEHARETRKLSGDDREDGDEADKEAEELLFQLRKEEYIRLVLAAAGAAGSDAAATIRAVRNSTTTSPREAEPMAIEPDSTAPESKGGGGAATRRRKSSLASTSSSILRSWHGDVDPHLARALAYGGQHFRPLLAAGGSTSSTASSSTSMAASPARTALVCSLLTSPLYLPLDRLLASPYGSLYAPYISSSPSPSPSESQPGSAGSDIQETKQTTQLRPGANEPLHLAFTEAYLRTLSLPKNSPLTVVTDVGGTGALAKIMKVRAVMKEKKTEWSAVGELPVEIPLPLPYRYHSIFACPVSKEQSTAQNPPMLLPCGHVIARESLMRLARGTPTLKCPYCPVVSHFNACVRVHF